MTRPATIDHEGQGKVELAAAWLIETPVHHRPEPLIPALQKLFGLSAMQSCEACRLVEIIRMGGAHDRTS